MGEGKGLPEKKHVGEMREQRQQGAGEGIKPDGDTRAAGRETGRACASFLPASEPRGGRNWLRVPGKAFSAAGRTEPASGHGAAARPRLPRALGGAGGRLPGQGARAGRPRRRRRGVQALAARAPLHGAAGGAAGAPPRRPGGGRRAGDGVPAGPAVRPAPVGEGDRKRPCSPRVHRASCRAEDPSRSSVARGRGGSRAGVRAAGPDREPEERGHLLEMERMKGTLGAPCPGPEGGGEQTGRWR